MATLVVSSSEPQRPRPAPKDSIHDQKEEAKERRLAIVEGERDKQREHEKAKKKLRLIAVQKSKNEQEAAKALDEIHNMTPDQATSRLDLLMAQADLTVVDKMAAAVRTGVGHLLDFGLQAQGCIASHFESDSALQQALVDEFSFAASFVNNKMRIALCVSSDTLSGFQAARKKKKEEKTDESGVPSVSVLGRGRPSDLAPGGSPVSQPQVSAHLQHDHGSRTADRPQSSQVPA
jgi:hypothetical protein